MPAAFILDTNVLSSFHTAGWFETLGKWPTETPIVVSAAVWEEFQDYASLDQPDWLAVESADLDGIHSETPGALAPADWSCIALATGRENARLITNDQAVLRVASARDLRAEWGTRFLLRVFQCCFLTKEALTAGQDEYITDLGLSEDVANAVRTAQKDNT